MKKIIFLLGTLVITSSTLANNLKSLSKITILYENHNMNKDVNIYQNNSIDLNSLIKNTNLFTIKTNGAKVPSVAEIIKAAKKVNTNPNIDWSKITVDEHSITNMTATLVSTDASVYNGNVRIKYTVDASIDLNSLIKNTNLFTIKKNGAKVPSVAEIIKATKKVNTNPNIDWSKITVDEHSITNTGAELISTDTTIYSGAISVTFIIALL